MRLSSDQLIAEADHDFDLLLEAVVQVIDENASVAAHKIFHLAKALIGHRMSLETVMAQIEVALLLERLLDRVGRQYGGHPFRAYDSLRQVVTQLRASQPPPRQTGLVDVNR